MTPLGASGGTLSRVTGALLSPGLSSAAAYLCSGKSGLCALTLIRQIVYNRLVHSVLAGLDAEYRVVKLKLGDCVAVHIVNRYLCHYKSSSLKP